MKTDLTIEQSQRLIELGVDVSKASKEMYTTISEQEYNDPPHPIFTLADLLGLLPKWLKYRNKMPKWLNIWVDSDSYTEVWCLAYKDSINDIDEVDTFQSSEELVDCLALLLEELIKDKLMQL